MLSLGVSSSAKITLQGLIFDLARSRYRGFARVKISRREREQADRALWAEVLEPVKIGSQNLGLPRWCHPWDKTVHQPNCLGGGVPCRVRLTTWSRGIVDIIPAGRSVLSAVHAAGGPGRCYQCM